MLVMGDRELRDEIIMDLRARFHMSEGGEDFLGLHRVCVCEGGGL